MAALLGTGNVRMQTVADGFIMVTDTTISRE